VLSGYHFRIIVALDIDFTYCEYCIYDSFVIP
jgi:hypothetical protein